MTLSTLVSCLLALTSVQQCAAMKMRGGGTAKMMDLVPVAMDKVLSAHTDEPQLRTWESYFWGPSCEFAIFFRIY